MKKNIKIACVAAAVLAVTVGGIGVYFTVGNNKSDKDNVVYVNSVESIMNAGNGNGMQNRFSGVVEAQDTWNVELDSDKTVKDILVEAGQEVSAGTALFTYNTEKYEADLSQAELDLERMENELENMRSQITTLEKEKKKVSKEEQLDYTLQIQEARLNLKSKEYEQKAKEAELEKLKENIKNATVYSEISGVVKNINNGGNNVDMYGNQQAFMTIMATGQYRIKGKINEQNMGSLTQDQPVIIRSRLDKDQTWTGIMGKIDTEAPIQNGNNGIANSSGGEENMQSSSYPFYVTLENSEGLMLGQHVYIETDMGQDKPLAGVWLDSYFVVMDEETPYVWADNGKGKLEKKEVTIGQTDENTGKLEIADGLTKEDQITYPEEGMKEGMKTAEGASGTMGQSNPPQPEETDGEMMEEQMSDEGITDMDGEALPEDGEVITDEMIETEETTGEGAVE